VEGGAVAAGRNGENRAGCLGIFYARRRSLHNLTTTKDRCVEGKRPPDTVGKFDWHRARANNGATATVCVTVWRQKY